jgi:hypothetical protein
MQSIAKAGVLRTTRKDDIITAVIIVALLSLSVAGENFEHVGNFLFKLYGKITLCMFRFTQTIN